MAWAATAAWSVQAQSAAPSLWDTALPAPQLKSSRQLQELFPPQPANSCPSYIKAEQISGQADINAGLEGGAELRRGDTVIRADRVEYTLADDTVNAKGNVHINRGGNVYQGAALKLQVDAFQGDFTNATYQFLETQGHGDAERVEFHRPRQLGHLQSHLHHLPARRQRQLGARLDDPCQSDYAGPRGRCRRSLWWSAGIQRRAHPPVPAHQLSAV